MEWLVLVAAILLSFCLASVKALRFEPNGLSEFELARLVRAGDAAAVAEQYRRGLLPTFKAFQSFKELALIVLLALLLYGTHAFGVATLLLLLFFFIAYILAARSWVVRLAQRVEYTVEPHYQKYLVKAAPLFKPLAPKHVTLGENAIASRDELRDLIVHDTHLLAPEDKARLLGAFDFGSLLVSDAMVPRDKIATVDVKETVGPVLLDRLHKESHNVFVVINKNLDHIKGLLYMRDLSPPDPELKDVADATRPTVHYLPANAPLQDVLTASLLTGRQLFMVVDEGGATKGLVTLADALAHLNGAPLPKAATVSTQPQI